MKTCDFSVGPGAQTIAPLLTVPTRVAPVASVRSISLSESAVSPALAHQAIRTTPAETSIASGLSVFTPLGESSQPVPLDA